MPTEWFWSFIAEVQANACLQGLLVAAGSWIFEDCVSIGCAMLAASRDIRWQVVLVALTVGISSGDLALYLAGRFASRQIFRRKWLNRRRLLWAEQYFSTHMVRAVFTARFLPGVRSITFIAAGLLGAPFWRFTLLVVLASFAQTVVYLFLALTIGTAVLPYLENFWLRAAAVVAVLATVALVNLRLARRHRLREEAALPAGTTLPERTGCPGQRGGWDSSAA